MGSGVLLESYKRHRDMRGTAAAIAGEIFALLDIAERRRHVESFSDILKTLDTGVDVTLSDIVGTTTPQLDPVIDRHIERLGLLPTDQELAKNITTFYTYLQGIRIDLIKLSNPAAASSVKEKAFIIREDLKLWQETVHLGKKIIEELDKVADTAWWPWLSAFWEKLNQKAEVA